MTLEEKEAKKVELRNAIEEATTQEELDKVQAEVEALNNEPIEEAEKVEVKEEVVEEEPKEEENNNEENISKEEERKLIRDVEEVRSFKILEERKMEENKVEVRNTKEYIDAYARYIKTGKDEEVRSLLTENVTGGKIAVPDFVYDMVKTAWEKNEIMSLVRKVNLGGNFKVNFEISGSEAVVHTEGSGEVTEETLTLGIVELKPVSIKKWISISDEAIDLRGEAFLRYIYDELTQKIVKKTADTLVGIIAGLPATATATSPSANAITKAPAMGVVAEAIANLSDEASNPVVIMNKLTWANFKAVQYANGYGADPFEGLRVLFNNSLKAYDSASSGNVYMIVGDLGNGAMANYPNGEDVDIKYDGTTLMTSDLVRILGRQYVGTGVVADKHFALVKKPASV